MQVERQLAKAKKLVKKQQFAEARDIYQEVLAKFPANKVAQTGLASLPIPQQQVENIQNAINGLITLFNQNKFIQVIAQAEHLLSKGVNHATVHNVLAAAYISTSQERKAIQHYVAVLKENPAYVEGHNNLGNAYQNIGNYDKALLCFEQAIKIKKDWTEPYYNKAIAQTNLGKVDDAIDTYRIAIKIAPDDVKIANNLGALLNDNKHHEEAIEILSSILVRHPELPMVLSNRGIAYTKLYDYAKAKLDFEAASDLTANFSGYFRGYADLLIEEKNYKKSVEVLRNGVNTLPEAANVFDSLLLNQCYSTYEYDKQCFNYAKNFGLAVGTGDTDSNQRTELNMTNRPLKVGYISPDFRNHSVARFFEPLISAHTESVQTFCYYNAQRQDEVTKRIKKQAENWRDIFAWSDQELIDGIIKDELDILVDLSGHTSHNRLQVFAAKPAPIQISWLGYPDTTGLNTIDYRVVDGISDPEGEGDEYHTEALYRLPVSFLCYQGDNAVEVAPSIPSVAKGYITFGSFNNVRKITKDVISAWSKILAQVPDSRLLLKSAHFQHEVLKQQYYEYFSECGIASERIQLVAKTESTEEHLALYSEVDLCFDTFPYNGTTTTCEALWMGVPVVTYAGKRHSARVSASILKNAGMEEWVAGDLDGYIDLAVQMAIEPDKLAYHRRTLREQMIRSPICDSEGFTRNMEAAYQDMWQRFVASR